MLNLTIKIRPHLQKSSHLDFSPKIAIFVLSCKEIRRRRRRNGQAGARPCKRTVGDAGIGTEKASQTADIHQAYKCAGAPLSAHQETLRVSFFVQTRCNTNQTCWLSLFTTLSGFPRSIHASDKRHMPELYIRCGGYLSRIAGAGKNNRNNNLSIQINESFDASRFHHFFYQAPASWCIHRADYRYNI